MRVELFGTADGARMAAARALRVAVFVEEQHCPPDEEFDEHDDPADTHAVHALVHDGDGAIVATGRYYRADDMTAQLGRMAVRPQARGLRAGRRLLDALMDDARARGYSRAALNAQEHAIGFYAKAGFAACGAIYDEVGIPHQPMQRTL